MSQDDIQSPDQIAQAAERRSQNDIAESEATRSGSVPPEQETRKDVEKHGEIENGSVVPEFAKGLFTGIIFLATFGGSITFQTIIQDLGIGEDENPGHRFSRKRARTFLAISWVLFTIDLVLSSILLAMLYLYGGRAQHSWADNPVVRLISFILLPGVLVGALLFSSLAITAYSEPTGWTAVGFCGFFGGFILIWWLIEAV
ncbi:hypothetical protein H2198_004772 [Neophaeococcomyces mojaviensis]|uniref:Uncharacterized protein n=1 Tax=Neophaeococcomyces mojaviensis TaxID=3383035 RepID=A0ACC3A8A2_9EURO|nr:hypothetical protein H2198_004772 [Knufia sp. JES_112]